MSHDKPLGGTIAQVRLTPKQAKAVRALVREGGGVETISSILRKLVQRGLDSLEQGR